MRFISFVHIRSWGFIGKRKKKKEAQLCSLGWMLRVLTHISWEKKLQASYYINFRKKEICVCSSNSNVLIIYPLRPNMREKAILENLIISQVLKRSFIILGRIELSLLIFYFDL